MHFPKKIPLSFNGLFNLIRYLLDSVWITFHSFRSQFHIEEVRHVLFLFAIIVFTVSMSPHKQDFKYLIPGFAILFAILFFLEKFGCIFAKKFMVELFYKRAVDNNHALHFRTCDTTFFYFNHYGIYKRVPVDVWTKRVEQIIIKRFILAHSHPPWICVHSKNKKGICRIAFPLTSGDDLPLHDQCAIYTRLHENDAFLKHEIAVLKKYFEGKKVVFDFSA